MLGLLRRACGLSVAQLAAAIGVSPITVRRWEKGEFGDGRGLSVERGEALLRALRLDRRSEIVGRFTDGVIPPCDHAQSQVDGPLHTATVVVLSELARLTGPLSMDTRADLSSLLHAVGDALAGRRGKREGPGGGVRHAAAADARRTAAAQ
jgi:hypothetical protein